MHLSYLNIRTIYLLKRYVQETHSENLDSTPLRERSYVTETLIN